MAQYVGAVSLLAAAIGFYFFYFEGRGYIRDLKWATSLGVSATLAGSHVMQLLRLHKRVSLVVWIVVLFSGNVVNANGIRAAELGVVLWGVAGTMVLISATMFVKGQIILKTYGYE